MARINVRDKGAVAERFIAKKLEQWWNIVEPGCKFMRSPSSGGWATPTIRSEFKAHGDIITTAHRFPFTIEVKRREQWSLKQVTSPCPTGPAWDWWIQAQKDARNANAIPILIFRKNNELWRMFCPENVFECCASYYAREDSVLQHYRFTDFQMASINYGEIRPVMMFFDSFMFVPPSFFASPIQANPGLVMRRPLIQSKDVRAKFIQADSRVVEIDEPVSLIYMDPPFATGRTFKDDKGRIAYDDTLSIPTTVQIIADTVQNLIGCLNKGGSIFIHCDNKTVHHIRVYFEIFFKNLVFQNHIIWRYRRWTTPIKKFIPMHDDILFYTKGDKPMTFNRLYEPLADSTLKAFKGKKQVAIINDGHRKPGVELEDSPGVYMSDVWDLSIIAPSSKERTGYPTQKPLKLLERIILATTNPGDTVLDPFVGSGTTMEAAWLNNRHSIGIDSNPNVVEYLSKRPFSFQVQNPGLVMQYVGGKASIAHALAPVINQFLHPDSIYVEPFCGSLGLFEKIKPTCKRYILNDINPYLITMWKAVQAGWLPPEIVSHELYQDVKNKMDVNDPMTAYCGYAISSGGHWFATQSKPKSNIRTRGKNKGKLCFYDGEQSAFNYINKIRAHIKTLSNVQFSDFDYSDLLIPNGAIVYCDPPYKNTVAPGSGLFPDFDHEKFWKWADELSKRCIVLVSEFSIGSDESWECIFEKERTMAIYKSVTIRKRVEKIFLKGWLLLHTKRKPGFSNASHHSDHRINTV